MWGIELQRQNGVPLTRQIYQTLRDYILDGQIKAEEALPSTRELAKQLSVSRNTVCEAYEMLLAEGFVKSRQGSLTRVVRGLYLEKLPDLERLEENKHHTQPFLVDFKTGQPDLRHFPRHLWHQLLAKTFKQMSLSQLGYTGPEGLLPLREQISAWLFRSKGLTVNPKNIFITTGATQGLHLLADLLLAEGGEMLIEDPCHVGMLRALQGKGYPLRPVPVDNQGLQTKYLDGEGARAIYVTPSHQFPLGGILPANRRATLIRLARKYNLYIIEDDYDSEFRYCGSSVTPLYALDPQQVIYVGTFSKVLFPALRIGYVVLPSQLHSQWRYLRVYTDVQNPPFEQLALAEYLRTRKLDRYVQQMRNLYGRRRQVLLQTLEESLGRIWNCWGDAAGLHLALEFPGMCFGSEFVEQSREYGIRITPVEQHTICKGKHLDKLLIGYGHLEPAQIRRGILLLHDFMKENHFSTK